MKATEQQSFLELVIVQNKAVLFGEKILKNRKEGTDSFLENVKKPFSHGQVLKVERD